MLHWMRSVEKIPSIPKIKTGLVELAQYLRDELGPGAVMWELGSFAGESAEVFAGYFRTVHCVDPWQDACGATSAAEVEGSFDERAAICGNLKKYKADSLAVLSMVPNESVDFAYVDAAGADFFAAVTGRIYGRKLYLLEVQRHRLDATLLESTCKALVNKHGRSTLWSYQSGPEVGLSRLLTERGLPIGVMQARYNKLVRAQKTIRRWNDGEILVPSAEANPWQPGFLHRVSLFRGHEKDRDDEVDALVSVSDAMLGGAPNATLKSLGIESPKPYAGLMG